MRIRAISPIIFASAFFMSAMGPHLAHAAELIGCATAIDENDDAALKIAKINAITKGLRDQHSTAVTGQVSMNSIALTQNIRSSVSAQLKTAKVVKKQLIQSDDSPERKLCVLVTLGEDSATPAR
jgi:hypothetical protein